MAAIRRRGADRLAIAAPILLCALAAIAIQSLWLPIDADVSWLITVCERLLSGGRLYVDIVEVNPPASVWMYLPFVWLAHAIGVRPEAVVAGGFTAGGAASAWWTAALASRLENAPRPVVVTSAAAFLTLLFPMALFAQREHAALLLTIPALTALALIAEGKRLRAGTSLASGIAAGLVVAIKPHFALAIGPAALWAAWRGGSLKLLLPGIAAAAAVLAVYAAAFVLWARDFLAWLPVLSHTYLRLHPALTNVLVDPLLFPALVLIPVALLRPRRTPALAVTTAIGGGGFALAAIVQLKDYPNHLLPGSALALFAAVMILSSIPARREKRAVALALAIACLWQMHGWIIRPDPKLATAITEVAPPHPKIIALSRELATGHPVTRNVGGTWVGSRAGLYIAGIAHDQGLQDPIRAAGFHRDLDDFVGDVERNRPDVILVDREDKAWLPKQPEIARVMGGYRPAGRAGGIEIWVSKAPGELASAARSGITPR